MPRRALDLREPRRRALAVRAQRRRRRAVRLQSSRYRALAKGPVHGHRRAGDALMARKAKPPQPTLSRDEWALAFGRKADELRPDMGPQVPGDRGRNALAEAPSR